MGEGSKIEWTHHTFNPVWGCTKVSPGCAHCYAETFSKRVGQKVWGADAERRTFGDAHWNEPLKWNRAAEKAGERRRVFCGSMCDIAEDHPTVAAQLPRLWGLIRRTPWLDWLLLTKRPERYRLILPRTTPPNIWLGCTVENQDTAEVRLGHLLSNTVVVHFVSAEPLLGPLDLRPWLQEREERGTVKGLGWVIVGGESGHGARPMHPEWARSLRDQCVAVGVPFLFKQWGEWGSGCTLMGTGEKAMPRQFDNFQQWGEQGHHLGQWRRGHRHAGPSDALWRRHDARPGRRNVPRCRVSPRGQDRRWSPTGRPRVERISNSEGSMNKSNEDSFIAALDAELARLKSEASA